jgi:hypothetical protein
LRLKITIFDCRFYKIPAKIEGFPVKCIGGCAFCGCKGLTGVTIPNSVGWIGESAFTAATNLNHCRPTRAKYRHMARIKRHYQSKRIVIWQLFRRGFSS